MSIKIFKLEYIFFSFSPINSMVCVISIELIERIERDRISWYQVRIATGGRESKFIFWRFNVHTLLCLFYDDILVWIATGMAERYMWRRKTHSYCMIPKPAASETPYVHDNCIVKVWGSRLE